MIDYILEIAKIVKTTEMDEIFIYPPRKISNSFQFKMDERVSRILKGFLIEIDLQSQRGWRACSSEEFAQEVGNLPEYGKFILTNPQPLTQITSTKEFKIALSKAFPGVYLPKLYDELAKRCQNFHRASVLRTRNYCTENGIPFDRVNSHLDPKVHMMAILGEGFSKEYQFPLP